MAGFGQEFSRGLHRLSRMIWDEPPPVDAPRGYFKRQRLSEFLPYRGWDESREVYVQKNSVAWVIELVPLIGANEATHRTLAGLFTDATPDGAIVQVISYASPKIGDLVDNWAGARAAEGGVYEMLARHRREHFRAAAWKSASQQAPFYLRDFRIFITMEMEGSLDSPTTENLIEARDKFIGDIKAIESSAAVVGPQQLIGLVSDILNPTTNIRPTEVSYDENKWLCDQMVRSDTTWTRYRDRIEVQSKATGDGLLVGGATDDVVSLAREGAARDERFQIRGFSVKDYPEHWTQGAMSRVLGDMFNDQLRLVGPTVVTLFFRAMSAEKSRSVAEMKRLRTTQAVNNPIGRMIPESRKCAEDWTATMEAIADGAKLCRLGMFVLSIAPVKDAVRAERALLAVYRNSRFKLERDDDVHLQTVIAALPLGLSGGMFDDVDSTFGRLRRMPTNVAAKLAPLQGEFLGTEVPHLLLAGRRGQVLYYSIFGNREGNHNCAVVGSSGSGKSVLMQEMATSLRGAGAEVFVIDDGKSFMNSCLLQGGAFIQFNLDLDVCINPFSMIDPLKAAEDKEYFSEAIEMIVLMLVQAARGDRGGTPEETGALQDSVGKVWAAKGPQGGFQDVIDELAAHGALGGNLALSLTAYGAKGQYAQFFNGENNLQIDNPYTVFEMSDLEAKKDLRGVVMMAVLFLVRQRMKKGGRKRKKALIMDEAWQLLADGAMGKFIEGFARRCRKEGGALITGTQSLNDFYKTDGSRAAIENSDHMIVLRLKEEALEQLRDDSRMKVDDATMTLLKSLKVLEGEYSEMVVMGPDGKFIARLMLEPFSVTLYSTRPEVFAEVERLQERGVPLAEAVAQVARQQSGARR